MSLYATTHQWRLPRNVLSDSLRLMRPDGILGREGIVFWLGQNNAGVATIRSLVLMSGSGIQKFPLYMEISPDAMNALSNLAESRDSYLVGQIHSHPGTFVDLSEADIRYGVSVPYYLSVVAPHYGMDTRTSWAECGIHVFAPGAGFHRLTEPDVARAIHIEDARVAEVIEIGG